MSRRKKGPPAVDNRTPPDRYPPPKPRPPKPNKPFLVLTLILLLAWWAFLLIMALGGGHPA